MLTTCCLHRLQLSCHRGSIVHFFACCVLRLDSVWHSSCRETQSGTHWLTHRLPANITSCLPPLRPRSILPTFTTSSRRHSAFTQLFADHHSERRYATRPKLDVDFARHLVRVDRLCQPRDSRTARGKQRQWEPWASWRLVSSRRGGGVDRPDEEDTHAYNLQCSAFVLHAALLTSLPTGKQTRSSRLYVD